MTSDIPNAVLSAIEQIGIRYVRFTFCDDAGLIRSKASTSASCPLFSCKVAPCAVL
jgi:hypothetical protein